MATQLSTLVQTKTQQTSQKPQLVLEIDGVETRYGLGSIKKYIRIGDPGLEIGNDWVIGGFTGQENQLDAISLDGTTTTIAQQLLQDKGGANSVSGISVSLLDVNGEVTKLITPGEIVDDILGRRANVYLGYQDTAFPQDFIQIFAGVIDEVVSGPTIVLNIAHPEQKKRGQIFQKITTELASDITDSVTTIPVVEAKGFLTPVESEGFYAYVRINDEIIKYTGVDEANNLLTGCTREALVSRDPRAAKEAHASGDQVESFYRLVGSALDLALKIMMSGGPEYFAEGVSISAVNVVENVGTVSNAIYFSGINVADKYGVVIGDKVSIVSDAIAGNNVTDAEVSDVVATDFGSYIVLDATLTDQPISSGLASFKTKWNVWPEGAGLGMGGDEVDVPRFEEIIETFSSSIFDYDFYVRDTLTVKDFIDTEVLYPSGAFTIPRKGKVSVGFTSPPIGNSSLKTFDSSNTIRPDQNRVYRGISRYFYNNIVYKYDENLLDEGKFLKGNVTVDSDSRARIPVGNRNLVIEARGLRAGPDTDNLLDSLTQRFLDRFKYGAERLKVGVFYGDSYDLDVGDVASFGGADLQIPDTRAGSRETRKKLYEVVNKSLDIRSGQVTLDLVDTAFSLEGARYGVVSPSSVVGTGSTTTRIMLTNSFGNDAPKKEKTKWAKFVGEGVQVIREDADGLITLVQESVITGFDSGNPNIMIVSPALSSAPLSGDIVSVIDYPDNGNENDSLAYKSQFVFGNPSVDVTSGVSNLSFNVGVTDAAKFKEGQVIILHLDDSNGLWTTVTPEVKVVSVAGTLITVNDDLGVTPTSSYKVELIGFPDDGYPYRYL